MASLSSIKRILAESFPELKWMPQLLAPLNQFIEEINRALNNELTVGQNMNGVVKDVVVDGTYPVRFKWSRASRPRVAWIGAVFPVSGSAVVTHVYDDTGAVERTAAVSLDWEFDGAGFFKINGIHGLAASASDKYTVTIVALAG